MRNRHRTGKPLEAAAGRHAGGGPVGGDASSRVSRWVVTARGIGYRTEIAALAVALWLLAIVPGAGAQGSLPLRPIIDADNGVLGAELFSGAGPVEFFGGAGYGLFSDDFHYRAGASLGALRQRLTLSYQHWPGSLVEGRDGQTGTSLRWELSPDFGATIELSGFQGTLWSAEDEPEASEAWVMGAKASYWMRLGYGWLLSPRLTSVWGQLTQTGQSFTSHLATAWLRREWTRLQVAGGVLWSDDVPDFTWRLGGGGQVPLRGYTPDYDAGDRLVGLSLEHRLPLPLSVPLAQLQIALFLDAADALAPDQAWNDLSLSLGYGAGLVAATALGELHADLGWNPSGEVVPSIWLSTAF